MDRFGSMGWGSFFAATLACVFLAADASAQGRVKMVYNPVTGQTQPAASRGGVRFQRPNVPVRQAAAEVPPVPSAPAPLVEQAGLVEHVELVEPVLHQAACDCTDCAIEAPGCGSIVCDTPACGDVCGPVCAPAQFYTAFEFTFVKPRFESNVAFTTTESDGLGNDVLTDTEFDYDLVLTPRVFLGWRHNDGVGLRATWWQFDNDADSLTTNPPANGFGMIDHPQFATVDISSTVPGDTFSAASHLNAFTIDLEATMDTQFCGWDLGVAGGVRYASAEQGYSAQLSNSTNVLLGQIDYNQTIKGVGPTISLSASRPLTHRASLFARARGSVLFGDGESVLAAGEDLDLTTSFTTNQTSSRDDVMSIGEIQLGFRWQGGYGPHTHLRPFLTFAMEGQVWNGAGSATSEDGTLGFFGFASQLGFDW